MSKGMYEYFFSSFATSKAEDLVAIYFVQLNFFWRWNRSHQKNAVKKKQCALGIPWEEKSRYQTSQYRPLLQNYVSVCPMPTCAACSWVSWKIHLLLLVEGRHIVNRLVDVSSATENSYTKGNVLNFTPVWNPKIQNWQETILYLWKK